MLNNFFKAALCLPQLGYLAGWTSETGHSQVVALACPRLKVFAVRGHKSRLAGNGLKQKILKWRVHLVHHFPSAKSHCNPISFSTQKPTLSFQLV